MARFCRRAIEIVSRVLITEKIYDKQHSLGTGQPSPFSQMKTELIWEGKYDEYGNRRTVDIAGCAMPLQKIETIDEPASRATARIFQVLERFCNGE